MREWPFILAALGALTACGETPPVARNVLLISIDTLRPDHLGLYGYERPTSPFLDSLGNGGVVCERAFSHAPWTTPAHAALFYSTYPSVLGTGDWTDPRRIPETATSVAEALSTAGFRTQAFTDGGYVSGNFGFDQGFERYHDDPQKLSTHVKRALAWLDGIRREERFFLFLHTYNVHVYEPPPQPRAALVRPYHGPLLEHGKLAKTLQNFETRLQADALSEGDRRYVSDLYDATILGVDRQLERLWDRLEELGLARETLLVVTSDHGEELFDHGATGHGYTMYDENLRVPLIFSHPDLRPGRLPELVRHLDVAPTILDLAGVRRPVDWIGESMAARLLGKEGPGAVRIAYGEHSHKPLVSLRTSRWKYIERVGEPGVELFDLDADSGERANLAGKGLAQEEELKAALARLRNRLEPFAGNDRIELSDELKRDLSSLGYGGAQDGD